MYLGCGAPASAALVLQCFPTISSKKTAGLCNYSGRPTPCDSTRISSTLKSLGRLHVCKYSEIFLFPRLWFDKLVEANVSNAASIGPRRAGLTCQAGSRYG